MYTTLQLDTDDIIYSMRDGKKKIFTCTFVNSLTDNGDLIDSFVTTDSLLRILFSLYNIICIFFFKYVTKQC